MVLGMEECTEETGPDGRRTRTFTVGDRVVIEESYSPEGRLAVTRKFTYYPNGAFVKF